MSPESRRKVAWRGGCFGALRLIYPVVIELGVRAFSRQRPDHSGR
jgi:hypothetical protein